MMLLSCINTVLALTSGSKEESVDSLDHSGNRFRLVTSGFVRGSDQSSLEIAGEHNPEAKGIHAGYHS